NSGFERSPRRSFESWSHIAITLRADFAMEFLYALHHHPDPGTRAAIAVMLAQMQDQIAARNLAIKRSIRVKAVVPIDRKTEKPLIELFCFWNVEDAQYGYD